MRPGICALLLMSVLGGNTFVLAAEYPFGDAALREAVRLNLRDDARSVGQAGVTGGSRVPQMLLRAGRDPGQEERYSELASGPAWGR